MASDDSLDIIAKNTQFHLDSIYGLISAISTSLMIVNRPSQNEEVRRMIDYVDEELVTLRAHLNTSFYPEQLDGK